MPETVLPEIKPCNGSGVLLWDMAGTLIPFDPVTGRASALPGGQEFLPELGKDFRLVVTTGDETANAKGLLDGFSLLPHFEKVFGDLYRPMGKPYGKILEQLGGRPECSLAIGDRLRADLPADTDQVVTILVNQEGEPVNAGTISFLISILRKNGTSFPAAFRKLSSQAAEATDRLGDFQGGRVTGAWNCHTGFNFLMMTFQHPLLDGERLVIVI